MPSLVIAPHGPRFRLLRVTELEPGTEDGPCSVEILCEGSREECESALVAEEWSDETDGAMVLPVR